MAKMQGIRCGSQEPTFEVVGDYHHTFGPQCVRMFRKWGVRFYPCQERELDLFLARDKDNRYACRTICITKPRQNGKSFGVRFYAIECAAVEGKHVLFTAHRGKTVRKMFKFIRAFALHTPKLAAKLAPGPEGVYKAAGSEGVYFSNGGMIEFATRTDGGGRGETYDVIIFDEAQELTDEQYDAVVPTTIASETGDPQKIYLGTPPGPKCAGTVFQGQHDKAHSGKSAGIWWLEWAVADVPNMDDANDVLELAYQTNPAMGYRIREDVMLDAINTATSPIGFAREFLGWWSDTSQVAQILISKMAWRETRTAIAPRNVDKLAYGVRFTPDGRSVSLALAATHEQGCHVEYIRTEPTVAGVAWLVDWLVARKGRAAAVAIDGRADATDLGQRLIAAGMPKGAVMVARTSDAISADAMLVNAVNDGTLTHLEDPALAESALGATRRPIGKDGGYGFGGECPERLDACALALWAARTTKRDPRRRGRIG